MGWAIFDGPHLMKWGVKRLKKPNEIKELIDQKEPDIIIIEKPASGSFKLQSPVLTFLHGLYGFVEGYCACKDIELVIFDVKEITRWIKKRIGSKDKIKRGKKKRLTRDEIMTIFNIQTKKKEMSFDAADAICLGLIHLQKTWEVTL